MHAHDIAGVLDGLGEMEFATVSSFNSGHVGAFWSGPPPSGGASSSPWEMHPDTDELLMCVDGSIEIQILSADVGTSVSEDLTKVPLVAGQFAVVPAGHWHRHHATSAFKEFYLTPGRTEHSDRPDPRMED